MNIRTARGLANINDIFHQKALLLEKVKHVPFLSFFPCNFNLCCFIQNSQIISTNAEGIFSCCPLVVASRYQTDQGLHYRFFFILKKIQQEQRTLSGKPDSASYLACLRLCFELSKALLCSYAYYPWKVT